MIIRDYNLFENMQKAYKVIKELHIPEDDKNFLKLKELLKNNTGYMGTFTKWLFKDHEEFAQIEEIYHNLLKFDLDKPIDTFNKLEDLYDYMQSSNIKSKTNQVINSLPSVARKYVGDELRSLISLNIEHANLLKDFYSKKGGKYSKLGPAALLKDTRAFIENSTGEFNLENIKKTLVGLNINIAYESPELLMVSVGDYKTSCKIGSKHWCIATSENMWRNYVDGTTKQYFIWDFTKKRSDREHMIGATIGLNNHIKNAHWADDTAVSNPAKVFEEL